jgi:protocatechuate 3,4-dioxygenase alpha subunit
MSEVPTASQTVGPFFSIGLAPQYQQEMLPLDSGGARFTIQGCVFDGDGEPVPDAVLEIWHPVIMVGASGESGGSTNGVPNGFVRVATDEQGQFRFTGVKPTGIKVDGIQLAPHYVVLLFMRGLHRHLVTRVYLPDEPDEPSNAVDAVLRVVPEDRRRTLIAARAPESTDHLDWDIHLQGERETVFFET